MGRLYRLGLRNIEFNHFNPKIKIENNDPIPIKKKVKPYKIIEEKIIIPDPDPIPDYVFTTKEEEE